MTMGIKKMASITKYNYNTTMAPPASCSDAGKSSFNMNFMDLPYDFILCSLLKTVSLGKEGHSAQVTGKFFQGNYAVNSVYTVQNGQQGEEGQSAMMDLTMFAAYTIQGQMADNNEHLLAYESKRFGSVNQADDVLTLLARNNKISDILNLIDPVSINDNTIKVLVAMASIRAIMSNSDYSDFVRVSAAAVDAVETPKWWVIVVVVLAMAFLLPHVTRFSVRHIPHYTYDFRTILISSLGDAIKESWKGKFEAKKLNLTVGSSSRPGESDGVASLTIDGEIITRIKNIEETSFIVDEKAPCN